jgi:quercetin dioxygenase-like cupin family protein
MKTTTVTGIALGLTLALSPGRPVAAAGQQVAYIAADRTSAAFAKGQPLLETDRYKVHASRREAPGQAEIHDADTDVIYVLDGTATIVTGGRATDVKITAPGERRGATIDGGATQRLAKGDVFVVPNGVPHQFTEIQGPFLYYVVKVTAPIATGSAR